MRLDMYILSELSSLGIQASRTQIQKQIANTKINGIQVSKGYKTKDGDSIEYELETFSHLTNHLDCFTSYDALLAPTTDIIPTLYEDEDIIVINKPAGWVVHPSETYKKKTVAHYFTPSLTAFNTNDPEDRMRPGVVHRLDGDTSGLMLLAKNHKAKQALIKLFQNRRIAKQYRAIVKGAPPVHAVWSEPIGRHPIKRTQFTCTSKAIHPKEAKTIINRNRIFEYEKHHYALIQIQLVTGRTHQIRVHSAHHRHPILGDVIYSRKESSIHDYGLALCATELNFRHPISKIPLQFKVPLANHFDRILDKLNPLN